MSTATLKPEADAGPGRSWPCPWCGRVSSAEAGGLYAGGCVCGHHLGLAIDCCCDRCTAQHGGAFHVVSAGGRYVESIDPATGHLTWTSDVTRARRFCHPAWAKLWSDHPELTTVPAEPATAAMT